MSLSVLYYARLRKKAAGEFYYMNTPANKSDAKAKDLMVRLVMNLLAVNPYSATPSLLH